MLLLSALLVGCASNPRVGDLETEEVTEYPFGNKQLREGMKVGSRVNLHIEEGRKVHFEDLDVLELTSTTCTLGRKVVSETGDLKEDKGQEVLSWEDVVCRTNKGGLAVNGRIGRVACETKTAQGRAPRFER